MHQPVLLKEVLEYLEPQANENFVDATFGFGGHSREILKLIRPNGKVLGIEIDPEIFQKFLEKKEEIIEKEDLKRLILVNASYCQLKEIVQEKKFFPIKGVLFDLGVCSYHFDESERGFSYLKNQPLDMRFNPKNPLTAYEIVNFWPLREIERIIKDYSEERYFKRIARAIGEQRKKKKIETTFDLIEILKKVLPKNYENHRIHFATRTFQALRIAVNDELLNLQKGLESAFEVVSSEGKIVVISFHSLEDRIVKNFFKRLKKENQGEILTKKPISPSKEEIEKNHRARSAKLRVFQKI